MASGQKVAMSTFCISISFFEGRVCITHRCLQANMVTDTRYTKAQSAFIVVKHCFIQCPPTSPFSRATNFQTHVDTRRDVGVSLSVQTCVPGRETVVEHSTHSIALILHKTDFQLHQCYGIHKST